MESKERMMLEIIIGISFVVFLILGSVVVVNASEGSNIEGTQTTITDSFNTYNYYNSPSPGTGITSVRTVRDQPTIYTNYRNKPYIIDDTDYRYRRDYDYSYNYDYNRDYNHDYLYYKDDHYFYDDWNYDKDRYIDSNSHAQLRVADGLFGNDINNYEVYVANREYTGEYFKVVFYFEDYDGKVDSKAITRYIDPREESRFTIKDVSPNRYDYRRWWYEVRTINN